jgi:hypothetical protein
LIDMQFQTVTAKRQAATQRQMTQLAATLAVADREARELGSDEARRAYSTANWNALVASRATGSTVIVARRPVAAGGDIITASAAAIDLGTVDVLAIYVNGERADVAISLAPSESALGPVDDWGDAPEIMPAGPRRPYLETHPWQQEQHRQMQRAMFAAAGKAGLTSDRESMIAGINALLDLKLTSRTQLSPDEMDMVIRAIEAGSFAPNWTLRRNHLRAVA